MKAKVTLESAPREALIAPIIYRSTACHLPGIVKMLNSPRFRHAFKTALAMVIAYAIALGMAWEKPFWAGLAVAVGALLTVGDSVSKGLQRTLGTVMAGVAVIVLVAAFGQERWPFLISMSLFVALCNYMACRNPNAFTFWLCFGFTIPLVGLIGNGASVATFDIIIERTQETALGLLVYSVVAMLIWPNQAGIDLKASAHTVARGEGQLLGMLLEWLSGEGALGDKAALRQDLRHRVGSLSEQLDAAIYDSDEVWQARRAWRRCIQEFTALQASLERLYLCLRDLEDIEIRRFVTGLDDFAADVRDRIIWIEDGLQTGRTPDVHEKVRAIRIQRDALAKLSHFKRAAIVLCVDDLVRIGQCVDALADAVAEINGVAGRAAPSEPAASANKSWVVDLDALQATVRQSTVLWVMLLMAIYLPDFANYVGFIAITNAFAIALSGAPHLPAKILFKPAIGGTVFAGVLYVFIMPALSGFTQLSVLLFAATFGISYLFDEPKFALFKTLGLVMLTVGTGVALEQNYSILYPVNWLLAMLLFCIVLSIAWRVPISFKPEVRFVAMLNRFLSSAEYLLATVGEARLHEGPLTRWRRDFHMYEITVLPGRLRAWASRLQPEEVSSRGKDDLEDLLDGIEALATRIRGALTLDTSTAEQQLPPDLKIDVLQWRRGLERAIGQLATTKVGPDIKDWRRRLDAVRSRIEMRTQDIINNSTDQSLSIEQQRNMYRHLGEFRGLSEAVIGMAERGERIDWDRMRETRL